MFRLETYSDSGPNIQCFRPQRYSVWDLNIQCLGPKDTVIWAEICPVLTRKIQCFEPKDTVFPSSLLLFSPPAHGGKRRKFLKKFANFFLTRKKFLYSYMALKLVKRVGKFLMYQPFSKFFDIFREG